MIKKLLIKAALVLTLAGFIAVPGLSGAAVVSAAVDCSTPDKLTTQQQAQCGVNNVDNNDSNNEDTTSSNPNQLTTIIKNVINILLFLIGLIAVLMIVIAGFRFVTSNGDSNTISSARNTILYAVIGIVVAVSAYAIVNFVLINTT